MKLRDLNMWYEEAVKNIIKEQLNLSLEDQTNLFDSLDKFFLLFRRVIDKHFGMKDIPVNASLSGLNAFQKRIEKEKSTLEINTDVSQHSAHYTVDRNKIFTRIKDILLASLINAIKTETSDEKYFLCEFLQMTGLKDSNITSPRPLVGDALSEYVKQTINESPNSDVAAGMSKLKHLEFEHLKNLDFDLILKPEKAIELVKDYCSRDDVEELCKILNDSGDNEAAEFAKTLEEQISFSRGMRR